MAYISNIEVLFQSSDEVIQMKKVLRVLITTSLFVAVFVLSPTNQAAHAGSLNFGTDAGGAPTRGTVTIAYNDKLDPGTGAFTLEFWVKETDRSPSGGQYQAQFISGTKQFAYNDRVNKSSWGVGVTFDGPLLYVAPEVGKWPTPAVYPAGTDNGYTDTQTANTKTVKQVYETFGDLSWHHIAISKVGVGGTLSTYLDGVRVIYAPTDNNSFSLNGGDLLIGGGKFVGQIGDVRLVKGQGLYTGPSITVPTSQITTTSQGAIASNVSLLLKAGGSNCVIEDVSDNHYAVLINGVSCDSSVSRSISSYNVQFDNQGHGTKPSEVNGVTSIAFASLPTQSTDGNFTFQGWSETSTGSVLTGTYTPAADSTLYAIWQDNSKITHTVAYAFGGGNGTLPTQPDVAENESFKIVSSSGVSRAGYTFNGWNDGTTNYAPESTYTIGSANVVLTAQWTADTLDVTYNSQFGSEISAGSTKTDGQVTNPGNPARSGYNFDGWFTSESGGTAISFPYSHGETANFTLYAQWTGYPVFSASTPSVPNTGVNDSSSVQTQTITNIGTAALIYGPKAVVVTGANAPDFRIVADNCSNQSLITNGSCTVTYTFNPSGSGLRNGNLVFTDNAAGSNHIISLSGTGTIAPITIKRLSEDSSSIRGGDKIWITGTGFATGAKVTFGGINAVVIQIAGTTKILVRVPAHPVSKVSVVVTNLDSGSATIGGFKYKLKYS
jgi:uncharacterized repeat protein (TIGR02543 family)